MATLIELRDTLARLERRRRGAVCVVDGPPPALEMLDDEGADSSAAPVPE